VETYLNNSVYFSLYDYDYNLEVDGWVNSPKSEIDPSHLTSSQ